MINMGESGETPPPVRQAPQPPDARANTGSDSTHTRGPETSPEVQQRAEIAAATRSMLAAVHEELAIAQLKQLPGETTPPAQQIKAIKSNVEAQPKEKQPEARQQELATFWKKRAETLLANNDQLAQELGDEGVKEYQEAVKNELQVRMQGQDPATIDQQRAEIQVTVLAEMMQDNARTISANEREAYKLGLLNYQIEHSLFDMKPDEVATNLVLEDPDALRALAEEAFNNGRKLRPDQIEAEIEQAKNRLQRKAQETTPEGREELRARQAGERYLKEKHPAEYLDIYVSGAELAEAKKIHEVLPNGDSATYAAEKAHFDSVLADLLHEEQQQAKELAEMKAQLGDEPTAAAVEAYDKAEKAYLLKKDELTLYQKAAAKLEQDGPEAKAKQQEEVKSLHEAYQQKITDLQNKVQNELAGTDPNMLNDVNKFIAYLRNETEGFIAEQETWRIPSKMERFQVGFWDFLKKRKGNLLEIGKMLAVIIFGSSADQVQQMVSETSK